MDKRVKKMQATIQELGLDAFLITNEFSLKYLSGFDGLDGDGCLVVTPNQVTLITDARYQEALEQSLPKDVGLEITRDYYQIAKRVLDDEAYRKVGFETSVSYELYRTLYQLFGDQLVPENNIVEKQREVKDANEVSVLKKSTLLASEGFSALVNYVRVGLTERQISNWLNNWMLENGAEKPSFDTIVASGYRSALPHGSASNKKLQCGEVVTVDFGYYVDGYTSDITRTIALGDPGDELKNVYNIVHEAQERMFKTIKPGADGQEVDAAGRDYIQQQGFGNYYNHGSGHGIGLDIHEGPNFGPRWKSNVVEENNVMTVEPGIYLPGKGGVRIEDDLLITKNGYEQITTADRDLIIL
ncbi:M24 family metallopeptidase [Lentilactobacillus hilgardii]|uniref:M24 family metallopeptidase n=1 Tax=Lentilactobacillus hilgardii TaxID=1588 RepID=UPI000300ECF3|nr:Xaa-Pro peptidase family protein [Lentilactobacillus hilgardii]QIR08204.1 Aminopeptidase YpdF [Lentilactobacillus hilgardii]